MRLLTAALILGALGLCSWPAAPPQPLTYAPALAAEPEAGSAGSALSSSDADGSLAHLPPLDAGVPPERLDGFDEMLRNARGDEQRWTVAPQLLVISSVLEYRTGEPAQYRALAETLSPSEVESLVADLTAGLRLLTANTFREFTSVTREAHIAGDPVPVVRPGTIVVGRFKGVREQEGTIGFGGRRARRDGAITAAVMVLDSDFDRGSGSRRLLRTHELGHALGYNHVTSRPSIMNPRIGPEPTEFDRLAVRFAFHRARPIATN